MKKTTLFLTLVALIVSCKKEEITPTHVKVTPNEFVIPVPKMVNCLEHNQTIINNIIDSISEYSSWRKSMDYYYHIKTRDSLTQIYNDLIINGLSTIDAKFDMLDSMNLVWKSKESFINSEMQNKIEEEIERMKKTGEIWKCEEDTYNPNSGSL